MDTIKRQLRSLIRAEAGTDPYPIYRELRQYAPTFHFAPLDYFLVSRYDDVLALLRDRTVLVVDDARLTRQWPPGPHVARLRNTLRTTPFTRNPPDHARTRAAWARYFTAPRVRGLEAFVTYHVDRMLDDLHAHGHHVVDFAQLIGRQLPMTVITQVTGLPATQLPQLIELIRDVALVFGFSRKLSQRQRLLRSHDQLLCWLHDFVDYRRRHPDDGLISGLLATAGQPDAIPEHDIPGVLAALLLSGFETTAATLGNGAHAFATHPEQARLLSTNPQLAPNAVNEILRWDAPVQLVNRHVANPIDLHHVHIPAGGVLVLLIGAANRDPDRFPDPDRFDITRTNNTPLTFGAGPHRCLGAHLARLEAATLFRRLTQRFPKLRLAGTPRHTAPGLAVRSFDTLPITLR